MSNQQQKNRTLITDLPVAEQALSEAEMQQVQGGKKVGDPIKDSDIGLSLPGNKVTTTTPPKSNIVIGEKGTK